MTAPPASTNATQGLLALALAAILFLVAGGALPGEQVGPVESEAGVRKQL